MMSNIKHSKSSKSHSKSSKNRSSSSSSAGKITPEESPANSARNSTSSAADNKTKRISTKKNSNLSTQSMRYDENDGVIKVREIDGTALDSDEYYEYLYEDLIDGEGMDASRLVSRETVKINFDDEKNDSICGQCQMKFSDCPHINQSENSSEKKSAKAKPSSKKKKKSEA